MIISISISLVLIWNSAISRIQAFIEFMNLLCLLIQVQLCSFRWLLFPFLLSVLQMLTQMRTWCFIGKVAMSPWAQMTGFLCLSSWFRSFTLPPGWLSTAAQVEKEKKPRFHLHIHILCNIRLVTITTAPQKPKI